MHGAKKHKNTPVFNNHCVNIHTFVVNVAGNYFIAY